MRLSLALLVGAVAGLGASAAQAAPPAVEIKDAVARVTVVPEDRQDIRVDVIVPNPRLPLRVKAGRTRTVIDGGLGPQRIRGCRTTAAGVIVRVAGLGAVPLEALPQVVVRAPRDIDVTAGGAIFGAVGRARSLSLGAAGCGGWMVGNVEQQLRISLAGSSEARAGSAGAAKLRVAGAGDISMAEVRGRVDVDVAGSGDVRVKSVAGPLDVHIAGSGDVTVAGGRARPMTASIAGSGNILFGGIAEGLEARIAGSGDVRARQVTGRVKKSVMGKGAVRIG